MGVYAAAGAAAVLALALVLWWGGPRPEQAVVSLRDGGACRGAVLDDGQRRHELRPGSTLRLPPGRYRVTLLDAAGAGERLELELPPGATELPP